jgi:hypothetical protein
VSETHFFPDEVRVVLSPGQKWQIQEKGKFLLGGRCEPYVKTWGGWNTEEKAREALRDYQEVTEWEPTT